MLDLKSIFILFTFLLDPEKIFSRRIPQAVIAMRAVSLFGFNAWVFAQQSTLTVAGLIFYALQLLTKWHTAKKMYSTFCRYRVSKTRLLARLR